MFGWNGDAAAAAAAPASVHWAFVHCPHSQMRAAALQLIALVLGASSAASSPSSGMTYTGPTVFGILPPSRSFVLLAVDSSCTNERGESLGPSSDSAIKCVGTDSSRSFWQDDCSAGGGSGPSQENPVVATSNLYVVGSGPLADVERAVEAVDRSISVRRNREAAMDGWEGGGRGGTGDGGAGDGDDGRVAESSSSRKDSSEGDFVKQRVFFCPPRRTLSSFRTITTLLPAQSGCSFLFGGFDVPPLSSSRSSFAAAVVPRRCFLTTIKPGGFVEVHPHYASVGLGAGTIAATSLLESEYATCGWSSSGGSEDEVQTGERGGTGATSAALKKEAIAKDVSLAKGLASKCLRAASSAQRRDAEFLVLFADGRVVKERELSSESREELEESGDGVGAELSAEDEEVIRGKGVVVVRGRKERMDDWKRLKREIMGEES